MWGRKQGCTSRCLSKGTCRESNHQTTCSSQFLQVRLSRTVPDPRSLPSHCSLGLATISTLCEALGWTILIPECPRSFVGFLHCSSSSSVQSCCFLLPLTGGDPSLHLNICSWRNQPVTPQHYPSDPSALSVSIEPIAIQLSFSPFTLCPSLPECRLSKGRECLFSSLMYC